MEFIGKKELCRITALSYPTIFRLERINQFPKRRRLSPGRVAWDKDEVQQWLSERPEAKTTINQETISE